MLGVNEVVFIVSIIRHLAAFIFGLAVSVLLVSQIGYNKNLYRMSNWINPLLIWVFCCRGSSMSSSCIYVNDLSVSFRFFRVTSLAPGVIVWWTQCQWNRYKSASSTHSRTPQTETFSILLNTDRGISTGTSMSDNVFPPGDLELRVRCWTQLNNVAMCN